MPEPGIKLELQVSRATTATPLMYLLDDIAILVDFLMLVFKGKAAWLNGYCVGLGIERLWV